jgi:hypothetical protein
MRPTVYVSIQVGLGDDKALTSFFQLRKPTRGADTADVARTVGSMRLDYITSLDFIWSGAHIISELWRQICLT